MPKVVQNPGEGKSGVVQFRIAAARPAQRFHRRGKIAQALMRKPEIPPERPSVGMGFQRRFQERHRRVGLIRVQPKPSEGGNRPRRARRIGPRLLGQTARRAPITPIISRPRLGDKIG